MIDGAVLPSKADDPAGRLAWPCDLQDVRVAGQGERQLHGCRPKRLFHGTLLGPRILMTTDPESHPHEAAAEQVRAYLVTVRGGAPFLSGADGRLLLDWLEGGVPVSGILCAIDRVAAHRRASRLKSRMGLGSCKKEVKKLLGGGRLATRSPPPARPAADRSPSGPEARLAALAIEIAGMEVAPPFSSPRAELVGQLEQLATESPGLLGEEELAVRAIDAGRRFQERCWELHLAQHPLDLDAAPEALIEMRKALGERVYRDLVEEAARASLRGRFPLVCAQVVWDRVAAPPLAG